MITTPEDEMNIYTTKETERKLKLLARLDNISVSELIGRYTDKKFEIEKLNIKRLLDTVSEINDSRDQAETINSLRNS
jgi:SET domain-containing protein